MKKQHAARLAHFAALETIWSGTPEQNPGGGAIWRRLRRIELRAHRAATAQCNGAPFEGQPFRPDYLPDGSDGTTESPTPWGVFCASVARDVARALGGSLPDGFRLNTDARGYAIKIRGPEAGRPGAFIPPGMVTDWGSNGILAPEQF
jgi:hypothetical protein